jgi:hypothetical protein
MTMKKSMAVLALAGIALTGCLDLEVTNPNAADAERALSTPGDIEALIAGGYGTWWLTSSSSAGPSAILATLSNQHSATAANFGMVDFSNWPRVPARNQSAETYSGENTGYAWLRFYRSVSAVVDGLKALEGGVELSPSDLARARSYGYFVLGVAHGSAALFYDRGYIYDPSIDVDEVQLAPYPEVMAAALGYFDRAIQEAQGQTFTVPATWMSRDVSAAELARIASSYKARYRANVARTPAERAAVNWTAVINEVNSGITTPWQIDVRSGTGFASAFLSNASRFGPWGQMSYQVLGMADQSGSYQEWISRNPDDRHPNLSPDQTGNPFLLITADTRFPQGATVAAQQANRGRDYEITTRGGGFASQWVRPDRGPFRWSYYRAWWLDPWQSVNTRTDHPEITMAEMNLLKAEGHYRAGNLGEAATLINITRTAAGLNATNAAGLNTSCVPKLPNATCGDLFEMLKWEKRLETTYRGLHMASWYFNGRGWGDLAEYSFLQMPIPAQELELLGEPVYTFGGIGGDFSAPVGTYGY